MYNRSVVSIKCFITLTPDHTLITIWFWLCHLICVVWRLKKTGFFWSALVIGLVSIALLFQLHILASATGFYVTYFKVIIFFLHHLITLEKSKLFLSDLFSVEEKWVYRFLKLLFNSRSTQSNRLLLPKQIWSEFNFRFCFVNRE